MLKPFNVKDGTNLENIYSKWSTWNNGATGSIGKSNSSSSPAVSKICFPYNPESYISEQYPLRYTDYPSSQAIFTVPSDFTSMTYKWTVPLKISTGASNYDIGDYNNPLYLYSMSDTHEYIFEIEYTVIGLSYKNISFTIELSDTSGNNKNTLPPSSYTSIDISNGKKMSYTSSGGELTIWGVTISYSVI